MSEDRVIHETIKTPSVDVKAEKNTKGWNVTASVHDCQDVETAMTLLKAATNRLQREYGTAE
jgi:hypothetical protein